MAKVKIHIGRKEVANLPDFGLKNVVVKIDSGAYTSSIDVYNVQRAGDELLVWFSEELDPHKFTEFSTRKIKSSNGMVDERYIITARIELGGVIYTTQFSLTDRSGMRYPILLGRKLLNKNFLIDTSKTNLLRNSSVDE